MRGNTSGMVGAGLCSQIPCNQPLIWFSLGNMKFRTSTVYGGFLSFILRKMFKPLE